MPTIIADTLPVFPHCPGFGFTSQPDYLVKAVIREGGYEARDGKWEYALRKFNSVPLGPRVQDDVEDILAFWHGLGGRLQEFRFRDLTDYKSCRLRATPAATDAPLVLIESSSPATYLLYKRYAVSGLEHFRPIQRPVGDTIRIANSSGVEQEDWTLDEATGIVTPGDTFEGFPSTWGGEFEVRSSFDSDFPVEASDKGILSLSVSIKELRQKVPR